MASPYNPGGVSTPKTYPAVMIERHGPNLQKLRQPQHHLHEDDSKLSNGATRGKLLTVDEALQYSPLSSVVPFSSNIVSAPTANYSSLKPVFSSPLEAAEARQSMELLDQSTIGHHDSSHLAQRALQDLQPYLNSNSSSKFEFSTLFASDNKLGQFSRDSHACTSTISDGLGPFAKLLLNRTDLSHRYPTPSSSDTSSPSKKLIASASRRSNGDQTNSLQQKPTTAHPLPSPLAQNQQNFAKNAHHLATSPESNIINGTSRRHSSLASSLAVVVPPVPPEARSCEYVTFADDTAVNKPNSLQKSNGKVRTTEPRATGETRDQRAIADGTSRLLQDLVQDILEAEDDSYVAQSDGMTSSGDVPFFVSTGRGQGNRVLSHAIQVKLDSFLLKSIQCGRLQDLPVDQLSRLQRICESGAALGENLEIQIEPSWSEDDFAEWGHRVEDFDLALRSSRTILRIMTGGREEKELYSEELLQSILRLATKTLQTCIIPVVESRSTDTSSELFQVAMSHRKEVLQLLYNVSKLMTLFLELLLSIDMAENIVNTAEFFAINLLFVESSHNEKDSALGIQKYEALRRIATDIITVIFSRYPEQRPSIFDEILTSLQKLPTSRQHARQFKLPTGENIQLVSALILRLVQESVRRPLSKGSSMKINAHTPTSGAIDIEEGPRDDDASSVSHDSSGEAADDNPKSNCDRALRELSREASSLSDGAGKSAQYVIRFFVSRAMTAPKTGDQPYRHLLDIFSEDLVAVLGLPEWPAAELLLRALLVHMLEIAEKPKFNAPAKNMALELLGLMGSATSDLVASTRLAARSLESDEAEFSGYLRQLLDEYMDGAMDNNELLGWQGPYRAVAEYLQPNISDEAQSRSAQAFYLTQWAKGVVVGDLKPCSTTEQLCRRLRRSLTKSEWVAADTFEATSDIQSRLAYALTVLNMDFCRQFDRILKVLLDSISSEQITIRTRSLKSVTQMLEKDPSLLDRARHVKALIMKCATDKSSMVRDSALLLVGKCIVLRPALEQEFYKPLLIATHDTAVGVRKRAMKLLKDIYIRNTHSNIRSAIGDSLLQRTKDLDKAVADLARQMIEEVWLAPFWDFAAAGADVRTKISFRQHVKIIVNTVQRGELVGSILSSVVKDLLTKESKNVNANLKVCENIVATAFECMTDTTDSPEHLEQHVGLQALVVFSKASPRLFTSDQLQYLKPYIGNLSNADDLHLFRSAVAIFRCVLPIMSSIQHPLLRDVQLALLQSLSKLGPRELDEVAACLWTINGTLKNPEKLIKLMKSVIGKFQPFKGIQFTEASQKEDLKLLRKYIRIAGYLGKHCDLEDHLKEFRDSLPWWKGTSVAGLLISCIYPYIDAHQPLALRADAFNSIGLICQSQPYQFNQKSISSAFENVLNGEEPELQNIVLSGFRDFFAKQEKQSELKYDEPVLDGNEQVAGKLGTSMTASDSDGASALIAQRFLRSVLHISLGSQEGTALSATEVIACVNRQGLVHPKESGSALIALETSTNPAIADIAMEAHRTLHQQHESMFEREYMRAVTEAFNYQRDIIKDPLGYTSTPYGSKLRSMFEIINSSKGKYQKKFLSGFCGKIDFDPTKLDVTINPPAPLQYARFLIENLAFFEYGRMDELLHTLACMEKIVSGTGSGIAHSINTEIFQVKVDSILERPDAGDTKETQSKPADKEDISRLRQLTTASIILSSLWDVRTFLRRLYGIQISQQRRDNKAKASAKDLNRVPTRAQGITGDRVVKAIAERVASLDDPESMLRQCQEFVELMSVDNEVKVASEGEDGDELPGTPEKDADRNTPVPSSGGSRALKRKGSTSASGTPQKRKRGRPSVKRTRSVEGESDSC